MPSKTHRRGHDIIVIGASAGGVEALPKLAANLPSGLPASVFMVVHTSPSSTGLPAVIGRNARLPVIYAEDGEKMHRGCVYIAPPDRHLLIGEGRMHLSRGPRENGHRPAIDPLFRTAASSGGPRVVGVVLTGYLDDGTAGLSAIKARQGVTVVQHPEDATVADMPRSALRNVKVDFCVRLEELGALLVRLAKKPTRGKKRERAMEKVSLNPAAMEKRFGAPTSFVCPECNGPLWETDSRNSIQFKCHVGHAYSPESLLAEQDHSLERAVWSAVRIMEERAALLRRLGRDARHPLIGGRYGRRADELEQDARMLCKLINGK